MLKNSIGFFFCNVCIYCFILFKCRIGISSVDLKKDEIFYMLVFEKFFYDFRV